MTNQKPNSIINLSKKEKTRFQFLLCFFLIPLSLLGQTTTIDSLKNLLEHTRDTHDRIDLYEKIGYEFLYKNPDTANVYIDKLIDLSENARYDKGLALGYNRKGTYYIITAQYSHAIRMLLKAIPYYEKLHDSSGIAKVYGNIGALDYYLRDYKSALENFNRAMNYVPENDSANNASRFLTNFSGVYRSMNMPDSALVYANKAIRINTQLKQPRELSISYVNMGAAQFELKEYDKALATLNNAIDYPELPTQFLLIARIYKARSYIALGQIDAAEEELEDLEDQCDKLKDQDLLLQLYKTKSEYFAKSNDYKSALAYSEKYIALNAKLHNTEQIQTQQNLKVQFETKQKEDQNKILRHEAELQELKINNQWFVLLGVGIFILVLLMLLIIMYRLYKMKQKANSLLYEKHQILNANNKNLEQINSQKNNLFSIVAHDIKSPLSVIISTVDMLKENINSFSKEELLMLTTELSIQTKGIYRLLDGVLAWARSQMDGYVFEKTPVEVNSIIENILLSKVKRIEEKNIRIDNKIAPGRTVVSDAQVIEVVIRNFTDNALKFTPVNGAISFTIETIDNEYRIAVSDTGVGMSKETIKKIFEDSTRYTSKGTNQEVGNGIGLILCKDIVHKLGGDIEVESEPGKGSIFTLVLPLQ